MDKDVVQIIANKKESASTLTITWDCDFHGEGFKVDKEGFSIKIKPRFRNPIDLKMMRKWSNAVDEIIGFTVETTSI